MGASCAKGSKTTDPDKTPYQPAEKKGKHGIGKSAELDNAETAATPVVEQRGTGAGERGRGQDERKPPQGIGDSEEVKVSVSRCVNYRPSR